jgi:hypothetical protein
MATPIDKLKAGAKRLTWKRALIIYSVAVSTLAFILVIALYNSSQTQKKLAGETTEREKNRDALLARYDRPLINTTGDKVLLPELKIALPATIVSRTVLYQYNAPTFATNGTTTEGGTLASRTAIVESAKPGGTDGCNILAEFTVNSPKISLEDLVYAGNVTLADGRTIYIYQNKADCAKVWGGLDSGTAILLLRQATSYK